MKIEKKKFRKKIFTAWFTGIPPTILLIAFYYLISGVFVKQEDKAAPFIWILVNMVPLSLFMIGLYFWESKINYEFEVAKSIIGFRALIFYVLLLFTTTALLAGMSNNVLFVKIIKCRSFFYLVPFQLGTLGYLFLIFFDFDILNSKSEREVLDTPFPPEYNPGQDDEKKKPIETNKKEKLTIDIFLASSEELKEDRKEVEIFIGRENKKLNEENIFLNLIIWEDFLDAMATERLQDEYNKAVMKSDVFISLFGTKVGKFTEEEFDVAYKNFQAFRKPEYIYTYFKSIQIDISKVDIDLLQILRDFQKKVSDLGHYYTTYKNTDDLKLKLNQQLDKIISIKKKQRKK